MTELYDPSEPERVRLRARAAVLLARYNATSAEDADHRREILCELFGHLGE